MVKNRAFLPVVLKRMLLGLSILIVGHLHAAETKPCYLALMLPPEMLDHIASFLNFDDRETQKEFIERAQALEQVVPRQLFTPYLAPFMAGVQSRGVDVAYAALNEDIIIVIDRLFGRRINNDNALVTPIVTIAHTQKQKILHKESLNCCTYAVALSRNARTFAYIYKSEKMQEEWNSTEYFLTVKNLTTNDIQNFSVPKEPCSHDTAVSFNKQGTEIIVHHAYGYIVDSTLPYTIFPLVLEEEIARRKQKTLSAYFRNKLVCKTFGCNT